MSHYDQKEKRTLAVYILIFVLLAAGIAIGGLLSYRNFEEQFLAQAESQLSAIAELKVNDLVNWRKERLADAEILHQSAVFATLAQSYFENPQDASAQAQLQDWLDSYQIYPDYDRVRLLDAQSQTRLSSPVDLPPISSVVAQRIPEVLQSKQVTLVDFYRRETDQSIALGILIPILDSQTGDQVIGLVAFSIDPQVYLYPFIQRWPSESASAETLLVRRDGSDVLFLNQLRFQPDAALNLRLPLTKTDLPAVKAVLGQSGVMEGMDYRSISVVADARPIPDSPWFLVSKMNAAEVYAPLRERLREILGLAGMAILVAGAGLMLVWRRQRIQVYRAQAEAADAARESERQLKEMQVIAGLGSYALDFSSGMWTSSDVLDSIFGIDEKYERSIAGWADLIHPSDRQQMTDYFTNEVIGKRRRFDKEYKVVRKNDGAERWVHGVGQLEFDAQDQLVKMLGTIQDITERKRAEAALLESEERFRRAMLGAPFPIMIHAEDGEVVTINTPWAELTGYNHKDIPTIADWTQKAYGARMDLVRADIDGLYALNGPKAEGEYTIMTCSGKARVWDFSSAPVGKLPDGRRLVISMAMDVTERKQAEEKLAASEIRYRRLFEAAKDGILILDAESGMVMDANPFLIEMLGFPQEEFIGKELWELGFFKDIAANKDNFLELQQMGYIRYEDLPLETADGRKFHVEFVSNVYLVDHRKVVQCNIRDITERKQTENMIAARLRLVEFSAHHSLDELLTKTLDEVCIITDSPIGFYHFVEADQKTLSLQAWSTRTMQEYCKAEGKGLHYDLEQAGVWADCVRERQPVIHNDYASLAHRRGLPAGHAELARELVVPILREGLIVAILGVGNKAQEYAEKDVDIIAYFADVAWEIARRKRTEQALADYTNHLEEMVDARTRELRETQEQLVRHERLATLGQLAGSIGHELRNPLGVISNAIYFLKAAQPDADDKVKDYLGIIEKEARISDKIITDLLDYTRIKSMEREAVSVSDLLHRTFERFPAPAAVQVILDIPADLPQVVVDPHHIVQVLGNLTVNAYQAMQDSGRLTVDSRQLTVDGQAFIVIALKDTGAGVLPENINKLFEPLFTTKTKGIGLGLAVSKKLLETNGGKIEVQSEAGAGSTFTIWLPIWSV